MNEEWRHVVGYEGIYEVSNFGRVRALSPRSWKLNPGGIIKPKLDDYLRVTIYKNGERKTHAVHVLVATAFLGPRPDGHVVDHVDNNKQNNHAVNLQYLTWRGNTRKSIALELESGVRSNGGKLTKEDVESIRSFSREGMTRAELGRQYGVSAPHITRIVQGNKWKEDYATPIAVSV